MIDPIGLVNGALRVVQLVLGNCGVNAGGMEPARITFWASIVVIITGSLWGFYWIPMRGIAALGLTGAWGTIAIVGAATVC